MILPALSLLSVLSAAPTASTDPLCVKRAPCTVTETLDAGKDARGRILRVKHLSLGWMEEDTRGSENIRFGEGRQTGGKADRPVGSGSADEWWLLRSGAAPQLLLSAFNNGYGGAVIGEDEVTVSNNRFVHSRSGGNSDLWIHSTTLQLSPLALVGSGQSGYAIRKPERGRSVSWDAAQLKGSLTVPAPVCGEDEDETAPVKETYTQAELSVPLLPRIQLDESYLEGGWKQTALGTCALEANSFVLGKAGSPQDAALKALLVSKDTLVLEVRDDHWTGPSDTWLADDHVEVWLGPTRPGWLNECTAPTAAQKPVQWGVRIADGKVFPAYGDPKDTLQVEKVELREAGALVGYRLKVGLPRPFEALSVLYSDSDSGKKQERLLGTSAVKYPRPETLNAVREVSPNQATCEVRDGALAVKLTPLQVAGPDTAVLPLPDSEAQE